MHKKIKLMELYLLEEKLRIAKASFSKLEKNLDLDSSYMNDLFQDCLKLLDTLKNEIAEKDLQKRISRRLPPCRPNL